MSLISPIVITGLLLGSTPEPIPAATVPPVGVINVSASAIDAAVRRVMHGPTEQRVAARAASTANSPERASDSMGDEVTTAHGVPVDDRSTLSMEVTVAEVAVDPRVTPDYTVEEPVGYRSLPEWAKRFRFPDYGQSNSPCFDEVTQQYWWE